MAYLNLLDYNPQVKVNISDLIKNHPKLNLKIKEFLKKEFPNHKWKYRQIINETKERGITQNQLSKLLTTLELELSDTYKDIRLITKGRDHIPPLIPLNDEFLTFCGLYLSDGYCSKKVVVISNTNQELQQVCKRFVGSIQVNYTQPDHKDMYFHSVILANFFKSLGKTAHFKRIQDFFYNLSNDQLAIFLRSLFDGDGYVEKTAVCYLSASRELVFDIKNLLLRFSITSRIKKKNKVYRKTEDQAVYKKYFELRISGKRNLERFKENISFSLIYKNKRLKSMIRERANTNVDLFPMCSQFIKNLRMQHNLTQKELAKKIGCTRSYISLIEHNKRFPSKSLFSEVIKLTENQQKLNNLLKFNFRQIVKIRKIKPTNEFVYDISVADNENFIAGFGNIFVHNTLAMAAIIKKTLAAQLYSEFKAFFPDNAVEYFVSYYDYYQPEAYMPQTDTYVAKDASINERIEMMRLSATSSLLERQDVIVVASVSCIYSIGAPKDTTGLMIYLKKGEKRERDDVLKALVDNQYVRNDLDFARGRFRVRGDVVEIFPAYSENIALRIEWFGEEIEKITEIDPLTGKKIMEKSASVIYPARHFVFTESRIEEAIGLIEEELEERLAQLGRDNKLLYAQRLEQRTRYDLEMIKEVGYCSGIENYSRYFDGRKPGERPYTLLDYYPDNFLMFIDESHVTIPQVRGMYGGDKSRKDNLIKYGFRLESAYDNRPLFFSEFEQILDKNRVIYVSATPSSYELNHSEQVAEMIVRPTGLIDPEVIVKSTENQIDDLISQIQQQANSNERTLVTTLTKRMAEDLTDYLLNIGLKVRYLHSDIETLERIEILRDLRLGKFDTLIGINLLREGLDLPEVSLVAILDADKEGFLRSEISLIQTIGRASRNVSGRVVLYADEITGSIRRALDETDRRRMLQIKYNEEHGITPKTISKEIRASISETKIELDVDIDLTDSYEDIQFNLSQLETEMKKAADNLEFERAAAIRDKIFELRKLLIP
jgi:excinuclease ABC B subunit